MQLHARPGQAGTPIRCDGTAGYFTRREVVDASNVNDTEEPPGVVTTAIAAVTPPPAGTVTEDLTATIPAPAPVVPSTGAESAATPATV